MTDTLIIYIYDDHVILETSGEVTSTLKLPGKYEVRVRDRTTANDHVAQPFGHIIKGLLGT